jgi:hypothetical protein
MKRDDSADDVDGEEIGEGTTNYTIGNNFKGYTAEDNNAVQSIYMCVLYRSNYGKSCAGKTIKELLAMKSLFKVCFQYKMENLSDECHFRHVVTHFFTFSLHTLIFFCISKYPH